MTTETPCGTRRHQRISLPQGMSVTWYGSGQQQVSRVKTLSMGGLFLCGSNTLRVGTGLTLDFLRNHREAIAAMDFFTVPTINFGLLYCFFVISHGRRRILHLNVTKHPTSLWVVQQLRESFPFELAPRFLIFDRDAKYGLEVPVAVRSLKMSPVRSSFESPWQNGVAERWVESCRRDLLDHVIAVNGSHLKRLLSEYVRYYHEDRTHLGLRKGTPEYRIRSTASGRVLSQDRLGGLHHRYVRAA
jgi:putative transposase